MKFSIASALIAAAAATVIVGTGSAHANDSIVSDYNGAVQAVGEYWAQKAPQLYGRAYEAPTVRGIVEPGSATACGPMDTMNAAYCGKDHSVQFGSDYLTLAASIGDIVVYDVVAHEWAHAVLAQQPASVVQEPQELQAECLAGAALGDMARSGKIVVEDGDADEFVKLFEFSDAPGDAHGTAKEQAKAFNDGWQNGPAGCF